MTRAGNRRAGTRVGIISLGCAKNLVDTEVMLGHLDRAGCRFVQDPAEAEVILINTCGFIEPAREESIRTILEAAERKKTGKLERLVVAGCLVQRYPRQLRASLPEVDAFVGLDELEQIVGRVRREGADASLPPISGESADVPPAAIAGPRAASYLYDERTPRKLATPPWSAYVKIAEGCDHTCSFCAIPGFRGRFRSRSRESIVGEAEALARSGVREISLIAQDSSHFGRDHGIDDGLARLLDELGGIDALHWIRVHYLYPNTVTDRLIETMARLPKVVKYADLPLQHSHPATLRRMRRGGGAESHLKLLERFRAAMPGVALRSTFLVGFPGETEEEFVSLLDFVAAASFDHAGVFTYSHEERTPAFGLGDDVPEEVKQDRRERLMRLQQEIAFGKLDRWVGRRVEGLVEGAHPETEHLLVARMATQAPDVDGQILIHDGRARSGEFVEIELTGTAGYDLVGRIVSGD